MPGRRRGGEPRRRRINPPFVLRACSDAHRGIGHVKRRAALARVLAERGATADIVVRSDVSDIVSLIEAAGVPTHLPPLVLVGGTVAAATSTRTPLILTFC